MAPTGYIGRLMSLVGGFNVNIEYSSECSAIH